MGAVAARAFWYKVAALALVVLTLLVGTLRPLVRMSTSSHSQSGLSRRAFVFEPPGANDTPLTLPAAAGAPVVVPLLLAGLLTILKSRRLALVSFAVRRLKIPPPSADPFSPF
jgi:hypothetical protein